MALKQLNLIFAVKDGITVSIEDVESGLKCNCICPACGEPLIAKKGTKMMHHFAHHAGHNCEYGYESSLHLAAKEILSKAKQITLPAVYISFPYSSKEDELYSEAKEIEIERVELEKRFNDIIPDVVIYTRGKKLYLEVFVTHPIDDKKLLKLKKANISTIEIDLSKRDKIITYQELNDILLGDSKEKTWKYNSKAEHLLKQFYKVSDLRPIITRGLALHVDYCPINIRTWRGKAYANFIDDCSYCQYHIATNSQSNMLCSGRARISTLKDFKIPEDIRIKESDDKISISKPSYSISDECPNCDGKLIECNGQYGNYLGCSNYPYCRFTAPILDND